MDDAFIEDLYNDVSSLYRLDMIGAAGVRVSAEETDLGKLPETSVILLASLAAAWVFIIAYAVRRAVKEKAER